MTRYTWAGALGASLAIAALSGAGVFTHEASINTRRVEIAAKQNENAYVRMIAGDQKIHGAPGHLARFVNPALEKDNPVKGLIDLYVSDVEFDHSNAIIWTDVVSLDDISATGSGPLSPEFILLTLQARDNPEDVTLKIPKPKERGPWQYGLAGILVLLPWVAWLLAQPMYRASGWVDARARRRARVAYLATLTPTARSVLRIKEELEATKPKYANFEYSYRFDEALSEWKKSSEGKAHARAEEAFELATKGWRDAEQRQRLAALAQELNLIIESEKEGQRTYEELG